MKKVLALTVAIAMMCTILVACGDDIVGVYKGSYKYNETTFDVILTLNEDGTYSKVTMIGDEVSAKLEYEYELKDDKLLLYLPNLPVDKSGWVSYEYVDGKFQTDDHTLEKE